MQNKTLTLVSFDVCSYCVIAGAIVTDTINFSPLAGRSTPKDEMIADQLETFLPSDIEKDALFDDISKAKCDLSGLMTFFFLR